MGHTADDPGSGDTAGRAAGRFMSHVGRGTGARFCFGGARDYMQGWGGGEMERCRWSLVIEVIESMRLN